MLELLWYKSEIPSVMDTCVDENVDVGVLIEAVDCSVNKS